LQGESNQSRVIRGKTRGTGDWSCGKGTQFAVGTKKTKTKAAATAEQQSNTTAKQNNNSLPKHLRGQRAKGKGQGAENGAGLEAALLLLLPRNVVLAT